MKLSYTVVSIVDTYYLIEITIDNTVYTEKLTIDSTDVDKIKSILSDYVNQFAYQISNPPTPSVVDVLINVPTPVAYNPKEALQAINDRLDAQTLEAQATVSQADQPVDLKP